MFNLYKLITKFVSHELSEIFNHNEILSENQLDTRQDAQGAKDQFLIHKSPIEVNNK